MLGSVNEGTKQVLAIVAAEVIWRNAAELTIHSRKKFGVSSGYVDWTVVVWNGVNGILVVSGKLVPYI